MKSSLVNIVKKAGFALGLALVINLGFMNFAAAQGTASVKLALHPDVVAGPKTLAVAVFQVENSLKFKVHLENYVGNDVIIKIKNDQNKVIYVERVKKASKYIRKFDFSTMVDGNYTFEVSNKKETYSKDISLQTLSARSLQIND